MRRKKKSKIQINIIFWKNEKKINKKINNQ
jgi:hypothetical protein